MICKKCGRSISDGAKFCSYCGTKVGSMSKSFCPTCGAELEPGAIFCPSCGIKVGSQPVSVPTRKSGNLLNSIKGMTLFHGEPTASFNQTVGTLSIYNDRLEFKPPLGDEFIIAPLSQISNLRVGKYLGVYNTLVVTTNNGTIVSLCPAIPASSVPQNIIVMLQPYM